MQLIRIGMVALGSVLILGASPPPPTVQAHEEMLRSMGHIGELARLCKLRHKDWMDDLQSAADFSAILPKADNQSPQKAARDSRAANRVMVQAQSNAENEFLAQGRGMCSAVGSSQELRQADALVANYRKGKATWRGYGAPTR